MSDPASSVASTSRPEDSRGAHDSTRRCIHSWRVDRIAPTLTDSCQLLLERNARFLGDVPQFLDDRQNQRHTIHAPHLFHLPFGIARNQRPVGARRWFGGAKDADVVVYLMLERITIHKTVDAHGAKEMADTLANAA